MIKIIDFIDIIPIVSAYENISKDIIWQEGSKQQSGLQYKTGQDPWMSAVGKGQGDEFSYTNLNPFFKGTVFEEIIKKYQLTRTRFMWCNPYTCYSMHCDSSPRIHIPMITNPECYFVFKGSNTTQKIIRHLPTQLVYWTDTRLPHTFMNCSEYPRLHLVGVVEK